MNLSSFLPHETHIVFRIKSHTLFYFHQMYQLAHTQCIIYTLFVFPWIRTISDSDYAALSFWSDADKKEKTKDTLTAGESCVDLQLLQYKHTHLLFNCQEALITSATKMCH